MSRASGQPRPGRVPRLRRSELVPMTPLGQLRAPKLGHRLVQLTVGLILFGVTMGFIVRAGLGLEPWSVLTSGAIRYIPISYGEMTIAISVVVLLLWIPLRQWPGLGTVANSVVIGVAVDATLAVLPAPESLGWRVVFLIIGVVGNGIAGAIYIGSQLGPGPRDGLMTGLARRTGRSIRLVRTSLEITVVIVGVLLGGALGVGTLFYALAIGPVVQFFLPLVTVELPGAEPEVDPGSTGD